MKLSPLTCVQILLAVGVIVAIFTMNIAVLIGTVLLSIVVGFLYWWKNRSAKYNKKPKEHETPQKIDMRRARPSKSPMNHSSDSVTAQAKKAPVPNSYESVSSRVGRDIAARNLLENLPEPPSARLDAMKAAYALGGPGALGLKSNVPHMRNIQAV